MRKGALKKKQRQLEELHLDRREALGELVVGMYVQGSWDDEIMSRGAAEVREVAEELKSIDLPAGRSSEKSGDQDFPVTGEYTAEHDLPATGEHTAEHDLPATDEHTSGHSLPESGEPTAPETPATAARSREYGAAGPKSADPKSAGPKSADPKSSPTKPEPVAPAAAKTASAKAVASEPGTDRAPGSKTGAAKPSPGSQPEGTERPLLSKSGAGVRPDPIAAEPQQKLSELDQMAERIDRSQSAAKTAAEAAKAAAAADARTELSAITREIESDRGKLDSALSEAAGRIASAEKRATEAEARLARESAANREAAADWVRSQAAEIEADAALAAEIAAGSEAAGAAADASGDADRPELEARIKSLETALEAEKASRAEALTIAESRLKAIEQSARDAEKRVEEAEAAAASAGDATARGTPASTAATEAQAREAAVVWLRGQILALRMEIAKGETTGAGDDS
jgi:hypothetical protein